MYNVDIQIEGKIPSGGELGQILQKASSGVAWEDLLKIYASHELLPEQGIEKILYYVSGENKLYIYNGTTYVPISSSGTTYRFTNNGNKLQFISVVDGVQTQEYEIDLAKFGITVSNAEINHLSGATSNIQAQLTGKVDKITGKGLSTNDYDNVEKQKVTDSYSVKHSHNNISALNNVTQTGINNWNTVTNKYEKPANGIPSSDFDNEVNASLLLADNSLQQGSNVSDLVNDAGYITKSVNNLDNYRTSSAQDTIDSTFFLKTNVEDRLVSTSTTNALSANRGRELNNRLLDVESFGRYLGFWNCSSGLPTTFTPNTSPFSYKAGDYYRVVQLAQPLYTHLITVKYSSGSSEITFRTVNSVSTAFATVGAFNNWLYDNGYIATAWVQNQGLLLDVVSYRSGGWFDSAKTDMVSSHESYHATTQQLQWYSTTTKTKHLMAAQPTLFTDSVTNPVNYRPNGSTYTGAASTTADTDSDLAVGDIYVYDGTNWNLQKIGQVKSIKVNGTEVVSGTKAVITVPTKISNLTDDTSTYPVDKADTLTGLTSTIAELNYVSGVTSSIQTQLNVKTSINDSSTTSATETWSASKINSIVGNIEETLRAIRGVQ